MLKMQLCTTVPIIKKLIFINRFFDGKEKYDQMVRHTSSCFELSTYNMNGMKNKAEALIVFIFSRYRESISSDKLI